MQAILRAPLGGSRLKMRLDPLDTVQLFVRKLENASDGEESGQLIELTQIQEPRITHDEILNLQTIFERQALEAISVHGRYLPGLAACAM
jgi:hypothetical protein